MSNYVKVLLLKKILISFMRLQTHHSQLWPDYLLPRFRVSLKTPWEDGPWGAQFGSCTACWSRQHTLSVSSARWLPRSPTTICLQPRKHTGNQGLRRAGRLGQPQNAALRVPEKHFLLKSVGKSHCGRETAWASKRARSSEMAHRDGWLGKKTAMSDIWS